MRQLFQARRLCVKSIGKCSKSSGFELSDEGNNAAHARLVQQQQGSEWASFEQ
jgi:hypothetical protein